MKSSPVRGSSQGYGIPYDENPGGESERVIVGLIHRLAVNSLLQALDLSARLMAEVAYGFGRALSAKAHSYIERDCEVERYP